MRKINEKKKKKWKKIREGKKGWWSHTLVPVHTPGKNVPSH
jgi:hypothetical protein